MARKKPLSKKKGARKKKDPSRAPSGSTAAGLLRLHSITGSLSSAPFAGDLRITGFHNQGANDEVQVSLYSANPQQRQTVVSTNHRFEVTFAQADVPSGPYLVEAAHVDTGASDSMFIDVQQI